MLEFDGDHIIAVFTGSKSFAATGLRFGYTVTRNKKFIENMTKGNYTQTAGLASPQQHALTVALTNVEEREKWFSALRDGLQKRRDVVYEGLKEFSDGGIYMPEGAFYFFLNLNQYIPEGLENKDQFVVDSLMKDGIAVVHGSAFGKGYEGYVRLSYSMVPDTDLKGGIDRLKSAVWDLRDI
jgi:aspartate/methionine/tyrosine aminotransferase